MVESSADQFSLRDTKFFGYSLQKQFLPALNIDLFPNYLRHGDSFLNQWVSITIYIIDRLAKGLRESHIVNKANVFIWADISYASNTD